MKKDQNPTSYRFSPEARELIDRLSVHLGISKVSVIELAVRRLARREMPDYTRTPPARRKRSK